MTKQWIPKKVVSYIQNKALRIKRTSAITRRDGFIHMARTIARAENMNYSLKISSVADCVKRANKSWPISQRQANGLIELLGSSATEKIMEGL